jgi:hypothetical protein
MGPIEIVVAKIKAIGDAIRDRTGTTDEMTLDEMAETIGSMNVGGGDDDTNTYILVDENGYEVPAVLVDEPVMLTASAATDIRKGMTAVTDEGVVTGEKDIPAYHTTEGSKVITNGSRLIIPILDYNYTKLQAIVCSFNTTLSNSVSANKVAINGSVYPVKSTVAESTVSVDETNQRIDLGSTNDSGSPVIIKYFSYKEIY